MPPPSVGQQPVPHNFPPSAPLPIQHQHQHAPAVAPQGAPAEAPAKDPAAGAKPKKPSWFSSTLEKYGKYIAAAALAGVAYGGHAIYERRQPYEWSGSVEARTVSVGSRVGGRVAKVLVREGQTVQAGDVLIVLDPGALQAQKIIAQADVEAAEANLEKLSNGARREEVAQASARVGAARAAAAQAATMAEHERQEAARTRSLATSGVLSKAELESVTARQRAAAAAAGQAVARAREESAALLVVTSGTRAEDIRVGRAQLEVAKGKLALVNAQLEELNIRAPARARVESVAVRPGDIIRADMRAVSLLEAGELYVRIYVPEPKLGNIQIGQEVPVAVDAFPKRTFRGRVEHINEVGEFTPRRLVTTEERADEVFAARIALLEGESELKAGMAAFIRVKK